MRLNPSCTRFTLTSARSTSIFHTSPHIPGVAAGLDARDFAAIPFPELNPAVQETIAAEVRRLRAEAEAGWRAAKRWFEEQLPGPAQP